jgi:hypothetical protein
MEKWLIKLSMGCSAVVIQHNGVWRQVRESCQHSGKRMITGLQGGGVDRVEIEEVKENEKE